MKLKELRIELEMYGDNRGKYVGQMKYEGERGNVELLLTPDVSTQLLGFIGPVITKCALDASKQLEASLQESISAASQAPLIEQTTQP